MNNRKFELMIFSVVLFAIISTYGIIEIFGYELATKPYGELFTTNAVLAYYGLVCSIIVMCGFSVIFKYFATSDDTGFDNIISKLTKSL